MSELKTAYQHCHRIAKQHYENFPVASIFLPRRLRPAVTVIYCFARNADDLADEGDISQEERLSALDMMGEELEKIQNKESSDDPVFIALADVINKYEIPIEPFYDLLSAFRQDVTKTRYRDFGELMSYCRRSANPVGRILLYLYSEANERNIALSDGICSALQLINFLQDIEQDYRENNRIYLPLEEMQKYHVTEMHIRNRLSDYSVKRLLDFQIERARKMLKAGAPLATQLGGRIGFELKLIIFGGTRILYRLHNQDGSYFSRPRLRTRDKAWVLWRSLFPK
ncbi:MAG: squalene synthase HpnC [Gammaproteobacteria bacterium]|nr:squalene synthase HpnC [Gammaproteobacteria bacterium]